MSSKTYAEARMFINGASKYIKSRREAHKRAKQIREKNGPNSMEWVQSALFMYAVKHTGLQNDLRRALWSYTSAMVVKLEEFVTNAEKIAQQNDIVDSYHWVALQLRYAIRTHMKLLDMFKDEVITVPSPDFEGNRILDITHKPSLKNDYDAMSYIIGEFRQKNPDASDVIPKKDEL